MFDIQFLIFAVIVLIFTFVISMVLTWCTREIAISGGLAAPPQFPRHLHVRSIPRLGGIPVFLSVLLTALIIALLRWTVDFHELIKARFLGAFVLPATVAFAAGLYDDIAGLRPISKLLFQCVSGVLMFAFGLRIIEMHRMYGFFDFGLLLSIAVTVFWVVLICNAINLIDGLDGLAAGSSLVSLTTTIFVAGLNGRPHIVIAAIVLSGALLGFLRFNFNPASIFLGDCGSLYLGVMLSGLSLASTSPNLNPLWKIAAAVIGFGLPLLETFLSVMRRILSGAPIFAADADHIHHRLLHLGLSHRSAVLLLYGVSGVCAITSCLLLQAGYGSVPIIVGLCVLAAFVGVKKLRYPEFKEIARLLTRSAEQGRVIANDVAVRKTAMKLDRSKSVEEVWEILTEGLNGIGFDAIELELVLVEPTKNEGDPEGDIARYCWSWTGRNWIPDLPDTWALSLTLADEQRSGSALRMFRLSKTDSLAVDVNILVRELQPPLRKVISKLLSESQPSQTDNQFCLPPLSPMKGASETLLTPNNPPQSADRPAFVASTN